MTAITNGAVDRRSNIGALAGALTVTAVYVKSQDAALTNFVYETLSSTVTISRP